MLRRMAPHSLATASGLLLGSLALAMAVGALVGAVFGSWEVGLLIGAVVGIPLGVAVVYKVIPGPERRHEHGHVLHPTADAGPPAAGPRRLCGRRSGTARLRARRLAAAGLALAAVLWFGGLALGELLTRLRGDGG